MTQLSSLQIARYAKAAGFTGVGLAWATAVALAESGGNTAALAVNNDAWHSRDRGLWQINDHFHPDVTDAMAFDPAQAATAAYRISNGGKSWTAWSTYNNGAARAQMNGTPEHVATQLGLALGPQSSVTQTAINNVIGTVTGAPGAVVGTAEGIVSGATSMLDVAKQVAEWFVAAAEWVANPHNWIRVLEVSGGAGLMFIGLHQLAAANAGPISTVAGTVTGAAGKAAHVAEAAAIV